MTDGTELSDELLDEIQSTMLLRIKDKVRIYVSSCGHERSTKVQVAAVRAMSCLCLARLQDPTNLDDDVVSAIIFAAEHDSSNIVRKSALANLGQIPTLFYLNMLTAATFCRCFESDSAIHSGPH